MHQYKYLKPEHAEGLMHNGAIRIGTLYEYRESEDERADKLEGSRQYKMSGSRVDTANETSEAQYLRMQGFNNCVFENSHPNGAIAITERVSKDCYIYCTSKKFDENNLNKFGGACIRIDRPNEFFSMVGLSLRQQGYVLGDFEVAEIIYCARDKVYNYSEDVPQDIPGWQVKPSIFSPEQEIRTMWHGAKETDLKPALVQSEFITYRTLEPIFLSVPELCNSNGFTRIA